MRVDAPDRASSPSRAHPVFGATAVLGAASTHGLSWQARLEVGRSDDPLEREADQIADLVTGMGAGGATAGALPITMQRARPAGESRVARERVGPKGTGVGAEGGIAPPAVGAALASQGRPLDPSTRAYFEPRFGLDLSRVRVHTDTAADTASRAIGARAFTTGDDIFFRHGAFQPGSRAGRHLIAHELTHTLQQRGTTNPRIRRDIRHPHFPCEETSFVPGGMNYFGTLAHLAIQQHYVSRIDGLAATEYVIPGTGPIGGRGRADIVSSIGGIYEIKPVNREREAYEEASAYVAGAQRMCDPTVPWHLGTVFWPVVLPVDTQFDILAWLEGPGMIMYSRRDRRRVPHPAVERERAREPATTPPLAARQPRVVPGAVPAPQPVPVTRDTGELIMEFAREVYESGADAYGAAERFLAENPELVGVIIALGVVAIIALVADDLTIAGVADDWMVPIVAALEWVAIRIALFGPSAGAMAHAVGALRVGALQ